MSNLNLNDLTLERSRARAEARRQLAQFGMKVAPDVSGMFVIMVEQLVFARVLEDRLLTVIAESNAEGGDNRRINDKIMEMAGELAAELIAELNASVARARGGFLA